MTELECRTQHEQRFTEANIGCFIYMHGMSPVHVRTRAPDGVTPLTGLVTQLEVNDLDLGHVGFNYYLRAAINLCSSDPRRLNDIHGAVKGCIGNPSPSNEKFDILGYGQFPQGIQVKAAEYRTETYSVKKSGLLGMLGITEKRQRQVLVTPAEYRPYTLGDLLTTTSTPDEPAYFVYLSIPTTVYDSGMRPGSEPEMILIASKREVVKILQTVKNNPQKYMNIVRTAFPEECYPHINRVIQYAVPHNQILFVDSEKVSQHGKQDSSNKYSERFIQLCGELVQVP